MSMHNKPLTPTEEAGLRAHGLDIGTPSQLSDAFRQGVAWAEKQERERWEGWRDWFPSAADTHDTQEAIHAARELVRSSTNLRV